MSHDHRRRCECVAEHRPTPLELAAHRILPGEHGGTYETSNVVWLCPTTHVNVHELLRWFLRAGQVIAWRTVLDVYEEPVNRYAYLIAARGFQAIMKAREEAHHAGIGADGA